MRLSAGDKRRGALLACAAAPYRPIGAASPNHRPRHGKPKPDRELAAKIINQLAEAIRRMRAPLNQTISSALSTWHLPGDAAVALSKGKMGMFQGERPASPLGDIARISTRRGVDSSAGGIIFASISGLRGKKKSKRY